MPRGGARPNTRPKGPFDKLKAHMRLQELYWEGQERMTKAQIAAAAGVNYLVARNKKGGKFRHLTAEAAQVILDGGESDEEIVEEWEKLPNPQAFAYLTDQALGRATQVIEAEVKVGADADLLARLDLWKRKNRK